MALEKQARLVTTLLQKTRAGVIDWRSSANEDAFQVSFKDNTAEIARIYREDQGTPDFVISLYNAHGSMAEQFSDVDLQKDGPYQEEGWLKVMADLHTAARRSALGSDKLLDEILNEIDDIVDF